ncbi:MAG: zinc-dependent metalloprotease [Propionibacteriaceae bacterium]|jgi:putative hydrolase|nr:zinc-dependent metalloprotease [Propionibacteriaceae bacterium]
MTDFGLPDGFDEDALRAYLRQFGITPDADGNIDPQQLMDKLQDALTAFNTNLAGFGPSDPASGMNWNLTLDIARRALGTSPLVTEADRKALADAVYLANLWLDASTSFEAVPSLPQAWTPRDWLERTFETWKRLEKPIVDSLSVALQGLVPPGMSIPGMEAQMGPMMRAAGAGVYSSQIGQALASLADTVLGPGDLGFPLTDEPVVALIPAHVADFAADLDVPASDVWLYLALRESARARLFRAAPWLPAQLLALVEHYAREIDIDPEALQDALDSQMREGMEAGDIAGLQQMGMKVADSIFNPARTDEQLEVLGRLETLIALVEGWVDAVVDSATKGRMPSAAGLAEMVARRRASGKISKALHSLLGLDLRPKRVREARNLWAAVSNFRGDAERDASWKHPDLLPSAEDLADPLPYAEHGVATEQDELDAEIEKLLGGE